MEKRMMERNHRSNVAKSAQQLVTPRPPIIWRAGAHQWQLDHTALIMGILNVTPDSFSDGGRFDSLDRVLAAAVDLIEAGANIIDIGGESTRPGASPVALDEELTRVIPVITRLVKDTSVAISIDTCKPAVASAALVAGAHIVNDISGLRDPEMIRVCADSDCGIVAMHMKGTPRTMQQNPSYGNVIADVRSFFSERLETLTEHLIAPERIAFDPGIGFGKTLAHNLALIKNVPEYIVGDRPILMGLSRKSCIGALLGDPSMDRREAPTQALTSLSRRSGAMIHRVHDVAVNRQALRMTEALISIE